jgi:hypothetical protein
VLPLLSDATSGNIIFYINFTSTSFFNYNIQFWLN